MRSRRGTKKGLGSLAHDIVQTLRSHAPPVVRFCSLLADSQETFLESTQAHLTSSSPAHAALASPDQTTSPATLSYTFPPPRDASSPHARGNSPPLLLAGQPSAEEGERRRTSPDAFGERVKSLRHFSLHNHLIPRQPLVRESSEEPNVLMSLTHRFRSQQPSRISLVLLSILVVPMDPRALSACQGLVKLLLDGC